MAELLKEVKEQRDASIKLAFGFIGDEAGAKNLYKVAANLALHKGVYPSRIMFDTGTDVTFKDSKLDEQIRTMRVSYDYHFHRAFKGYAFTERFTDTFMGIDDRYEIGGGGKLEWELRGLTDRGKGWIATLDASRDSTDQIIAALGGATRHTANQLRALAGDEALRIGIRKRRSRVDVGLAATLLKELEQASVETFIDTLSTVPPAIRLGTTTVKVQLPAETQIRGVIRPSVRFRPLDQLELYTHVYVKYPLQQPTRRNGRLDYRVDGVFEMRFQPELGNDKVALSWKVTQRYDNTPPMISKPRQDSERLQNRVFRRTINERTHRSAEFKIEVAL